MCSYRQKQEHWKLGSGRDKIGICLVKGCEISEYHACFTSRLQWFEEPEMADMAR